MLLNTRESYGLVAQVLHWVTAVLILAMLLLGIYMQQLPASAGDEATIKYWWFSLHKTLGVATLFVVTARIAWALIQPKPMLLNSARKLESFAAVTVHWLLYGAIIVMPITGWLHHAASEGFAPIWWPLPQGLPLIPKSEPLATLFAAAHFYTAILLGVSVFLHVAGALKHALVDRDQTLSRMIPGMRTEAPLARPVEGRHGVPIALATFAFLAVGFASFASHKEAPVVSAAQRLPQTSTTASDTDWRVDKESSRLAIEVNQSGTPVAGVFERWQARIKFDPNNLEEAHIEVDVDIASLALGGVSKDAKSKTFLNAAAFPNSKFVAREVLKTGADTFEARGTLTLAGETRPLSLPFRIAIENNRASVVAEVTLDRLAFGIGKAGFPGGGLVGIEVKVKAKVEAERVKAL